MSEKITFIGVGRMGGPFARHLLKAGHEVHVFDASADQVAALAAEGAIAHTTAAEAAHAAPLLFICLPTPQILAAVLTDEVLDARGLKVVVDLATSGPTAAKLHAGRAAKRGIDWVDCPVSGGISGAVAGTLALMVAGAPAAVDRVRPLISLYGRIVSVGEEPGLGQIAKIGNNLLAASAMVVTAEVMAMGTKAGLDPAQFLDIINHSTGRNSASVDKFPKQVLTGKFAHGFALGLSYKDVRMCIDEAEALGVPMVAGAAVRQMLAVTQAQYGADSDFTDIARLLEDWSDTEIRAAGTQSQTTA
jgi:3-hydroxyisobutyrate dehydrogenase-like beta-hydroxyacid dehydrogenase